MDYYAQSTEIFYAGDAYGVSQGERVYRFIAAAGCLAGLCAVFQYLGGEELSEEWLTDWKI